MKYDCTEARARLDDWLEGSLDEASFQEMELHLASCAACRAEEEALARVLDAAAALPREIAPPRDLWPGIEARIASPRARLLSWPRFGLHASWTALAAAAAVILVLVTTRGAAHRGGLVPGAPGATLIAIAENPNALLPMEREYERATTELMAALAARRADLPPDTVAKVEANLQTIDTALANIRKALAEDPDNAQLARLLTSTHMKKVDVLRRVVRLAS